MEECPFMSHHKRSHATPRTAGQSRLRVVLAEANSSRDSATVRVDSCTDPNPERTDSPTHYRSDLCPDPDPLHLAAGAAAFDQGRGGGARAGRAAVSSMEQAFVGLGILSGVS